MSEKCKWLHEKLEELPLVKYPFKLKLLPLNGIYFFYEKGEIWGHGGKKLRIVRIGTHTGANNFRNRIAEHYLLNEKKMNFNKNKPRPSDRSIFRKNIGRALLNKNRDPYLKIWNIDFLPKENRRKYGPLRDIEKEISIEKEITKIIREKFYFRFLAVIKETKEISKLNLERRLIGTVAKCSKCKPSENWLGRHSPIQTIRSSGLWLRQHINAESITNKDMKIIEKLVNDTVDWIKKHS